MLFAYVRALTRLRRAFEREDGQALVEYALLLSLIVVVVVAILGVLGGKISSIFTAVSSDF